MILPPKDVLQRQADDFEKYLPAWRDDEITAFAEQHGEIVSVAVKAALPHGTVLKLASKTNSFGPMLSDAINSFCLNQTKAMRVVMRSGKRPRLFFSANLLFFYASRIDQPEPRQMTHGGQALGESLCHIHFPLVIPAMRMLSSI